MSERVMKINLIKFIARYKDIYFYENVRDWSNILQAEQ